MSREELRGRAGGADEKVFGSVLASLEADGQVKAERDKVRLAAHEVRLDPEQQRLVDRLEQDFLAAEAAPPSPEDALARAGVAGDEEHELFQVLVEARKLVRVKESLFFHARALDAIQEKLVGLLRERKDIGPGDIVFIPPDTEHGLRTPEGGRWLAIWPTRDRIPGPRYRAD